MILQILGAVLSGMVFLSLALWVVQFYRLRASARIETELVLELLRQEFAAASQLRATREPEPAAWLGYRNFLVERKIKDGPASDSFYLVPQDGRPLPSFQPGQYVVVRIRMYGQGSDQREIIERRYPITSAPNEHFYCISVERRPDMALSGCLHQGIAAGTVVDVLAPRGELNLNRQRLQPVVLIADGVGATPCISMLETAAESNPDRAVTVIYGVRNGRDQGIGERLEQLSTRMRNLRYAAVESHAKTGDAAENSRLDFADTISIDAVRSVLPSNNYDFQLWGPSLMVASLKQELNDWGVSRNRVRSEIFGAPLAPVMDAINRKEPQRMFVNTVSRTLTWKPAAPVAEEATPVSYSRVLKNPAYANRTDDVPRRSKNKRVRSAIG